MSELRWLLLAAGLAVLAFVFWWTRREVSGKPMSLSPLQRREAPSLDASAPASPGGHVAVPARPDHPADEPVPDRIITIRLTGSGNASFAGEALFLALRDAGLRHGRFGIFHRHAADDDEVVLFSVASLVEPGSFDLTRIKTDRFPGVSLFLALPAAGDDIAAFDDMLSTARALASRLDGQLLDEQGSRLSVQRERFLREEVIQLQHKRSAS